MEFFNERGETEKTHHKLTHWQQGHVPVFATFRLADSLPQEVVDTLFAAREVFVRSHPKPWNESTENEFHRRFSVKLDEYLDAGHGCCSLRAPAAAQIIADRLHYFDHQRYDLHSYVVMPNHVHILFTPHALASLPELVKAWKGVSSRMIHTAGLSALNPFWQPDYFDRLIRSQQHFAKVMSYIADNPMKAHLSPSSYQLWIEQRSTDASTERSADTPVRHAEATVPQRPNHPQTAQRPRLAKPPDEGDQGAKSSLFIFPSGLRTGVSALLGG